MKKYIKKKSLAKANVIRTLLIILLSCLCLGNAMADTKPSDELQKLIDQMSDHSESDTAKCLAMMDRAMKLARQERNNEAIATCYFQHISFVVDADKMEYSQKMLKDFEAFVNKTGVGRSKFYDAWMNVVTTYIDANKSMSAAAELKRMLAHATQHKNYYGMANAYTLFGIINDTHEESMKNLNLALKYMKKVGRPVDIAYIYYTMAVNSLETNRLDEALSQIEEMMKLVNQKDFDSPEYYTRIADNICLAAYIEKGDKAKATPYYEKLKKLIDEKKIDSAGAFFAAESIIKYLCKFDDPDKMWLYYRILDSEDVPSLQLGVLAEYYKAKGDYKKALETYEKFDSISTAELKERQRQDFMDANAQYNNFTLEQRNQRLALDNATKTNQIEIGVIFILLIGGIGGTLFIIMLKRKNRQLQAERDSAELARKNEAAARKVAEGMNQMKTTFIMNISHEIRTPLNAIQGFNDLLNNQEMEIEAEERKQMFSMMCEKIDQLLKLSDQTMLLSQIDGDTLSIDIAELPLCAICDAAIEQTRKKLAPGVELKTDYRTPELTVTTDLTLMTKVIAELLDNSAKYTKQGHILLSYNKRSDGNIEISVADTGIGISKENATLAFENFEKLGSYEQGFGLGLPICQGIVNRLGGTITLDTNYSNGTRMTIVLSR